MTAKIPGLLSLLPGWRERWIAALRRFGWAVLLPKGRTARLATGPEGVVASVRAGGGTNRVRVRLTPLPRRSFEAGLRKLALRAASAASLLSGSLPDDAEAAFAGMRYGLLPRSPDEVEQSCTCGAASPCRHLLAVHSAIASRLASDPLLLAELRGWRREEIVEVVRRLREIDAPAAAGPQLPSGAPREEAPVPLPEAAFQRPESFFSPLIPLSSLAWLPASGEPTDTIPARLGPPPFSDPEASRLIEDFHRAIGLGAAERLAEWEWRRAGRS